MTLSYSFARAALLACLIVGVNAEQRSFKVVAFGDKVQLQVNGADPVPMARMKSHPYFTAELDLDPSQPTTYKFIVDGRAESFDRQFPTGRNATYNDFFKRKDTVNMLPRLGYVFEDEKTGIWTKGKGQTPLFDETYIPTIHLSGSSLKDFLRNPPREVKGNSANGNTKEAQLFVVLKDEVKAVRARVGTQNDDKQKFGMKLFLSEKIDGRDILKIRHGMEDPEIMREKLYTDLLEAVGAPVHQTVYTRVYVNGVGAGLFYLQDSISSETYITSEFHKGNSSTKLGSLFDAAKGSDFSSDDLVDFKAVTGSSRAIAKIASAVSKLDSSNATAVARFNDEVLDTDTFLKAMAFEYLTAHWDSYLGLTCNYVVYVDPTENGKAYFIDQDFEMTMGLSIPDSFNPYGLKYTATSYKKVFSRKRGVVDGDLPRRALLDKLLASPVLRARFETILTSIVKHAYNPVAMGRRIDALADRLREEVKWDIDEVRRRPANEAGSFTHGYTFADFDIGINRRVPNGPDADDYKGGAEWGLKPFIAEMATTVSKEFGFQWDQTPREFRVPGTTVPAASPENASAPTAGVSTGGSTVADQTTTTTPKSSAPGRSASLESVALVAVIFAFLAILQF